MSLMNHRPLGVLLHAVTCSFLPRVGGGGLLPADAETFQATFPSKDVRMRIIINHMHVPKLVMNFNLNRG